MSHPYMSKLEEKITRRIIKDAFAGGFTLSVFDGEEYVLRECRNEEEIIAALASSEYDVLHYMTNVSKSFGTVTLIWGNEEDLIHDNTTNVEKYLYNATAIAEKV